jgi:hypothetical protein
MKRAALLVAFVGLVAAGCPGEEASPLFPEDYASTYVEVRDCRGSGDHDLNNIRVLADPAALVPYRDRLDAFPEGAVVLKEEHGFEDVDCTGTPVGWTVMVRRASGSDETLGWQWQKVDADRGVVSEDDSRCVNCHSECVPPDGYEFSCAIPP